MNEELIAFGEELRTEVEEGITPDEPYSEPVFTKLVLERLADEGVIENPIPLPQGGDGTFGITKFKITGYSLADDDERLALITTIHADQTPPASLTPAEIRTAAERAVRFFTCSAKGLHEKIEPVNTDASELARKLFSVHDRVSFIRVIVLSDGLAGTFEMPDQTLDGTKVAYEIFGLERLFRVLGQGLSREDICVDIERSAGYPLPCLPIPAVDGSYKGYLAAFPGSVLADAYERYGTRLLELNVRAFLGVRGRKTVNAGLRNTLKDEPNNFLAYNNGIVATVDRIEMDPTSDTPKICKLHGLQIVNGGQTTASIHRARRIDGMNIGTVLVPAKIILVPRDALSQMVGAISRSANSQNTVQPADFSANDPFHVRVEELANNTWCPDGASRWFYERARGSYGVLEAKAALRAGDKRRFGRETPKERRFAKTDLAKYLNGWAGLPDHVSYGSQKNFQFFMQRLKEEKAALPEEADYKHIIAKAIIFRALQKLVRKEGFSAYQANIAAYTFAALAWRTGGRIDFDLVWAHQGISEELLSLMRDWSHALDGLLRSTAGQKMPSEWAKKSEAWETIRAQLPQLPTSLPPELASQTARGTSGATGSATRIEGLTAVDLAMIDEVRNVDAETWLQVAAWGQTSKQLHSRLSGICRTMAEYGLSGWQRSPSVKQAKWALESLKKFREEVAEAAGA